LLGVREFFELTVEIETRLGRQFKGTSDPRTLDIDLLFFNQDIISDDDLVVPHPLLHDRLFVLKPFQEIAPTLLHPILNETVRDLYEKIK
jgi:2-amino-4-hydroxy-6-hydroxymethyldihydropteridine diphosphokinase